MTVWTTPDGTTNTAARTCPVDATGIRTTTLSLATTTDTSATRTNRRMTIAKVTMTAMTATNYIYRRMLNPTPKAVRFAALNAPKEGLHDERNETNQPR